MYEIYYHKAYEIKTNTKIIYQRLPSWLQRLITWT